MIGTLTLPTINTPRFPAESVRKMSFIGFSPSKSAIRAAVAEAPAAVDIRKPPASLYEVLRVRRNASLTEIKTAYRSLAKVYHPDALRAVESSDGRDFIEIHNAYATLSDPTSRAMYDMTLSVGSFGGAIYGSATGGYYSTRRWETDQCW